MESKRFTDDPMRNRLPLRPFWVRISIPSLSYHSRIHQCQRAIPHSSPPIQQGTPMLPYSKSRQRKVRNHIPEREHERLADISAYPREQCVLVEGNEAIPALTLPIQHERLHPTDDTPQTHLRRARQRIVSIHTTQGVPLMTVNQCAMTERTLSPRQRAPPTSCEHHCLRSFLSHS